MTLSNTIYSVFSFTGFLFCAIPFNWHLAHRNTGTCLFMAWSGISCLYQFINSVIWNGNIVNWSPVWCDIGTRIYIGSSVGIPASSLCIFRRLYSISIAPGTMPTADKSERRHRVMIDLALGLGLPCLAMILGYIPQDHRYNILEDIGCTPATYFSIVAIILVSIPPILIGLFTACYAVPTIIAFNSQRIEFNDLLAQHSNLSSSFYLRLMCFGGLEILGTVPIASYFLYDGIRSGVHPWTGWSQVHSHFSNVVFVPRSVWENSRFQGNYELSRWVGVICAFNFFAFFGLAKEARAKYRAAYLTVARHIGLSTASSKPPGSPRPRSKKNDIEELIFTANSAISIPDGENHDAKKREGQTPQVNTTSTNTFFNADLNNCDLHLIAPTLPEPAVKKS